MTVDLLSAYGLTGSKIRLVEPELAELDDLLELHSPGFIEALASLDRGDSLDDAYRYGLGTGDNPIFPGIFEASRRYSGASICAAQSVLEGESSIAFNISGGLHHAHYSRAAGFCVLNDCALAVNRLRRRFDRVAYVDIDVHHGDGVQELFYDDPSVLTISIHELAHGFFPGTGHTWETGEEEGIGFSVNVPVAPATTDETWIYAWRNAALPILKAFAPDAIVLQMGADPHYLDPLAHVCLTAQGWLTAVKDVKVLGVPIVAIGGGGYNLSTVTRMWTLATAALIGVELDDSVPANYTYQQQIPELSDHALPDVPRLAAAQAMEFAVRSVEAIKQEIFAGFGL